MSGTRRRAFKFGARNIFGIGEFPLWVFSVFSVLKSEWLNTEDTEKFHRVHGEI